MKSHLDISHAELFLGACLFLIISLSLVPTARGDSIGEVIVEEEVNGEIESSRMSLYHGNISVWDFYNYYNGSPNTGFESPGKFTLIPFKSPLGETSLVVIAGDPGSDLGGRAEMKIYGIPQTSRLSFYDDPPNRDSEDSYVFAPPEGEFRWSWEPGSADGLIISGLSEGFELTINLNATENISGARMVSGTREEPKVLPLNREAKISLSGVLDNRKPEPRFSYSQVRRVGKPVRFDATNTADPGDRIIQYGWDFDGDGHYSYVSHNPVAEHTFKDAGAYRVRLGVTDRSGKEFVKEKKIEVVKQPLEATRELSTKEVLPGGTVRVTVELKARQSITGLGFEEEVPDDWEVDFPDQDEVAWKSSSNQWLLKRELGPGEVTEISYNLHAPSSSKAESPEITQTVDLSGKASSADPEMSKVITGDSRIKLTRSPDRMLYLAHYDPEKEKLDFSLSEKITESQLNAALKAWKDGTALPGLEAEEIDFDFLREALLYHQKGVDALADLSRPAPPELETHREIDTGLPDGLLHLSTDSPRSCSDGNKVEFTINVTVSPRNRTLMGVGLKEEIPESWEVIPEVRDDLVSKAETGQWIVRSPLMAREELEVSYRVRIPLEHSGTSFKLNGELEESWSQSSSSIRGDTEVEPISHLPVKLAISRWNSEDEAMDLAMDNYISEPQAEKAISLWVTDRAVPSTGGKKLRFSTIKEIMALQLKGKSVLGEYQLD